MLSREHIRKNLEDVRQRAAERHAVVDFDRFMALDGERRRVLTEVERLKQTRNTTSEEIAGLKKSKQDATAPIAAMKQLGEAIKVMDARTVEIDHELRQIELTIPNLPHESVPAGDDEKANRVEREWGTRRIFSFAPKAHWDIGADLGILDFERAARMTGTRFVVYFGLGARLERALINFMLDLHTRTHGYTEVLTPFIVNAEALVGTGQLPKFEADQFKLRERDYYLIPTAEVPVTNLHREEVLDAELLPLRYVAYSPCFRSEAGAYGKDARGLIRQHQFNKVELVKLVEPQSSYEELESLTRHAAKVLETLELPHRVVTLCRGDMGFSAAKTYDIEVWLPGQQAYREISSCSNFEDFQARRAQIRFKRGQGSSPEFVHTLNGSGLAVGRTLVAILENNQEEDGAVRIPAALVPFMDGIEWIRPPLAPKDKKSP